MLGPGSQGGRRQVDTSSRNDHLSRGWTTQMPPLLQAHREVRSSVRNQIQRAPAWPGLAHPGHQRGPRARSGRTPPRPSRGPCLPPDLPPGCPCKPHGWPVS